MKARYVVDLVSGEPVGARGLDLRDCLQGGRLSFERLRLHARLLERALTAEQGSLRLMYLRSNDTGMSEQLIMKVRRTLRATGTALVLEHSVIDALPNPAPTKALRMRAEALGVPLALNVPSTLTAEADVGAFVAVVAFVRPRVVAFDPPVATGLPPWCRSLSGFVQGHIGALTLCAGARDPALIGALASAGIAFCDVPIMWDGGSTQTASPRSTDWSNA
ncbi:hypothetical protein IP84_06545 [beta proteobacterium AAP99]|nr:hypothetical protein IP84_06545 [beta proteobacterium AAP99]